MIRRLILVIGFLWPAAPAWAGHKEPILPADANAQLPAPTSTTRGGAMDGAATPAQVQTGMVAGVPQFGATMLPLTGGTLSGALVTPGISTTGANGVITLPTGNTTSTLASVASMATAVSKTTREFGAAFGLTVNLGTGSQNTNGTGDKVSLYSGVDCQTSYGGACWGANTLATVRSGWAASGAYGASGIESDFNNLDTNTGETLGPTGISSPGYYNLNINGIAAYRSSAAIGVFGGIQSGTSNTATNYNRGIVFGNGSAALIAQCTFCDYANAAVSLDIWGSHTIGLDLEHAANLTDGMRLPNGVNITALTTTSGTIAQLLSLGGDNRLKLGPLNTAGVDIGISGKTIAFAGPANANQGFTAIGTSSFANGTFTDPAPGIAYDAKFGGSGAGIAVVGASLFGSTLKAVGPVTSPVYNTPQQGSAGFQMDASSATPVSLAQGSTQALPASTSGLVVITNYTNGALGTFTVGGQAVFLLGGNTANYAASSSPPSGTIGVYYDFNGSAGRYQVVNNTGASVSVGVLGLRTRASN